MNVANTAQNIDVSSQILDALAQILDISTYKLKAIARILDASAQLKDELAQMLDALAQMLDFFHSRLFMYLHHRLFKNFIRKYLLFLNFLIFVMFYYLRNEAYSENNESKCRFLLY